MSTKNSAVYVFTIYYELRLIYYTTTAMGRIFQV